MIRRLHKAEPTHVESIPITETFNGETIWDGVVEVFDLEGHPKAGRIYAWAHATDNPEKPRRHVTVLEIHPIKSARDAVRAAIVQELKSGESTAEEA